MSNQTIAITTPKKIVIQSSVFHMSLKYNDLRSFLVVVGWFLLLLKRYGEEHYAVRTPSSLLRV